MAFLTIGTAWAATKAFASGNKYLIYGVLLAGAVGFGYYQFDKWRDNLVEVSEKAGFDEAEKEYTEAINRANAEVTEKNNQLAAMNIAFDHIATIREAEVNVSFEPIIRNIQDEIANDPIYQQCVVSDSVRESINTGRATVNEAIDTTHPVSARPTPEEVAEPTDG